MSMQAAWRKPLSCALGAALALALGAPAAFGAESSWGGVGIF